MCGIAGILGQAGNHCFIKPALQALRERGPDGTFVFRDGPLSFGSTRLAIVDPHEGVPPFRSNDDRWVVFGAGEIYNALELRVELEQMGCSFRSRCDLEVVAHGMAVWGESVISRLEGMFALAIWDRENEKLLLARDPLGMKPLYWARLGDAFIFASEVRALHAGGLPVRPNLSALAGYFALRYLRSTDSPFEGVHSLPGASLLLVARGKAGEISSFPHAFSRSRPFTGAITAASLCEIASGATLRCLRADVPKGLYLSGGIDSWMLSRFVADAGERLPAYTLDFAGTLGEGTAAEAIAREHGHLHRRLAWQDDWLNRLPGLVERLEWPVGDLLIVAFDALAETARADGVKVVLSGEGPDEWFGGYGFQRALAWAGQIERFGGPRAVAAMAPCVRFGGAVIDRFAGLGQALGQSGRAHVQRWLQAWPTASAEDRLHGLRRLFSEEALSSLLQSGESPPLQTAAHALSPACARLLAAGTPLTQVAFEDQLEQWIPQWAIGRQEKIAMARGLEVRWPFLQGELAATGRVATAQRRLNKRDWREAARSLGWRAHKRPKQAFALPACQMVRSPAFRDLAHAYLSTGAIRRRNWYAPKAVAKLADRALSGDFLAAKQWAALLILEIWIETNSNKIRSYRG